MFAIFSGKKLDKIRKMIMTNIDKRLPTIILISDVTGNILSVRSLIDSYFMYSLMSFSFRFFENINKNIDVIKDVAIRPGINLISITIKAIAVKNIRDV